jgi:GTPase involved in cell partitioning and DNA repair
VSCPPPVNRRAALYLKPPLEHPLAPRRAFKRARLTVPVHLPRVFLQEWDGELFPAGGSSGKASRRSRETGSGPREGARSESTRENSGAIDDKNKHLFFDEAIIVVAGGAGGDGEAWTTEAKAKTVKNFKYQWGRNVKKFIELPPAEPADGGAGGNVYIRVDRACDSLLPFHDKKTWRAKKGYHGSAAPGAGAGRADRTRIAPTQEDLYIDVPPGTVVRRKRSGELLGDMTKHGQTLLIAEGGAGGLAARRAQQAQRRASRRGKLSGKLSEDVEVSDIELDEATFTATSGEPGQELTVELLMRVVADIGLVGLPNAGKSSILKAVTRASPEVAAYPFTTLMPNLGVVKPAEVVPDPSDPMDFSAYDTEKPQAGPVLADLPGLIQGAHKGRGLGRAFLRHLRRTRAMLVVVDASGSDPVGDYKTVREELRMYNPEYVRRPHILALNKMDLEWAALRTEELTSAVRTLDAADVGEPPVAVLPVSAVEGIGMDALMAELGKLMREEDDARVETIREGPARRQTTGEGTNMKIRF